MLTGNSGGNLLDGGVGADAMLGGAGNDAYLVDNIGDAVTESANEGADTVYSTADFRLSANVEPDPARQRRPAGLRQRPQRMRSTAIAAATS